MNDFFRKFASKTADMIGSPWAFVVASLICIAWAFLGPTYHYSDTWQLVINTGTTVLTFLIVFLIQNTQNRDAKAIHLKLDELLRGVEGARTGLVDLESLSDEELKQLQEAFQRLRKQENEQIDEICDEVVEEQAEREGAGAAGGKQPPRTSPVGAN